MREKSKSGACVISEKPQAAVEEEKWHHMIETDWNIIYSFAVSQNTIRLTSKSHSKVQNNAGKAKNVQSLAILFKPLGRWDG